MRKLLTVVIIISVLLLSGCNTESDKRLQKDRESELRGGLDRKLTVYTNGGQELKTYEGRFDIETTDDGRIKFDVNGKRVLIYNAVVVCEEK